MQQQQQQLAQVRRLALARGSAVANCESNTPDVGGRSREHGILMDRARARKVVGGDPGSHDGDVQLSQHVSQAIVLTARCAGPSFLSRHL